MISSFHSLIWWFEFFVTSINLFQYYWCYDSEYNTGTKKEAAVSNEALAKVKENTISTINCLKEEIINLKDIVIIRLQEENKKLREKCSKLENDALEQYGRKNNILVSGISAHVSESDL